MITDKATYEATCEERLQEFKENLFDIRRCMDEGVPCPYGICSECIASNSYRDFLSLVHTDLTDALYIQI